MPTHGLLLQLRRRALLVAWGVIALIGMLMLSRHQWTPSQASGAEFPPSTLPVRLISAANSNRATLMIFVHPHCPCSTASIRQLSRYLTKFGDRVSATALFVVPPGAKADWARSQLWQEASLIPGLRIATDGDGKIAASLGVVASGHVVLYSAQGRLLFSGGITAGRGHEGANDGLSALEASTIDGAWRPTAPVFGCELGIPNRLNSEPGSVVQ